MDWMFSQPWRGHYSQWSLFITFRAGALYGPCRGSWGLWMESFSSAYLHTLLVLGSSVLDLFQTLWIIRSFCFPLIPNSVMEMIGADWESVLFLITKWQLMLLEAVLCFLLVYLNVYLRFSVILHIHNITSLLIPPHLPPQTDRQIHTHTHTYTHTLYPYTLKTTLPTKNWDVALNSFISLL